MTPQEIISEIRKLPVEQQEEVRESLDERKPGSIRPAASGREFLEMLYAKGIIGNIPDPNAYTDDDDDFEPIEIPGKPTSEIIIEERR